MAAARPTRLLLGVLATNLADGLLVSALPLGIAAATGSSAAVALSIALVWAPTIGAFLLGGRALDRYGSRPVGMVVQAVRTAVLAGLAVGVVAGDLPPLVFGVVGGIVVAGEFVFDSSLEVILGTSTPADQLPRALGRLRSAEMFGNRLVGPALGGVLIAVEPVLAFGAAAVLVGVALVLVALTPAEGPATAPADVAPTGPADEAPGRSRAWRTIADGPMAVLMVLSVCAALGVGISAAMMVVRVVDEADLSPTAYGIIQTGSALGGIVAGVAAGRLIDLSRPARAFACYAAVGGAYLIIGVVEQAALFLVATIVFGIGVVLFSAYTAAVRQVEAPGEIRGRVTTTFRAVSMAGIPIGAVAAAPLVALWGGGGAFVAAGAIHLAGLLVLLRPRARAGILAPRPVPEAEAAA